MKKQMFWIKQPNGQLVKGGAAVTVRPVHHDSAKTKQEVHVVPTSSTAEVECPAPKSLQPQLRKKNKTKKSKKKKNISATGFKMILQKK